ncbi:MAG: DUF4430 domain-containing protein [Lagierella massiliensis]|nr:DUF4430 domain-containing protein [Lagierella massiliensis]
MKNKIFILIILIIFTFTLNSCKSKNYISLETDTNYDSNAYIEIVEDSKVFKKGNLKFNKGEKLLEVMKRNFDVEEKNGFIISIDSKSQDLSLNKYWLYDINGKMAEVGANNYILQENDEITFKLEVLKDGK